MLFRHCSFYGVALLIVNLSRIGLCGDSTEISEAKDKTLHYKCLQGFTGSLRGNRSAGISELQGLHVCLHSA